MIINVLLIDNLILKPYIADVSIGCSNPPQGEMNVNWVRLYIFYVFDRAKYTKLVNQFWLLCMPGRGTRCPHAAWVLLALLKLALPFSFLYVVIQQSGSSYFSIKARPLVLYVWPCPPPESAEKKSLYLRNYLIFKAETTHCCTPVEDYLKQSYGWLICEALYACAVTKTSQLSYCALPSQITYKM